MKTFKKIILIGFLPIFIFILIIYRQQNIAKRMTLETQTASGATEICSLDYVPVCGEDKVTYANECAARKNATKVSYAGTCRIEETKTETTTGTTNSGTLESSTTKTSDQYYNELEAQCGNDTCCVGSTRTMRVGNYRLADNGECNADEHINSADCAGSLQWCELGAITTTVTPTTPETTGSLSPLSPTSSAQVGNIAPEGKRTPYYNAANNYGFSVPTGDYFSGYGARDGANHTVGITTGTGVSSLETSQVKVYYYKKTLPELTNAENGILQDGDKTYVKLSEGSAMIEGDTTGKTVNTIIATIRNGSGSTTPVSTPSL